MIHLGDNFQSNGTIVELSRREMDALIHLARQTPEWQGMGELPSEEEARRADEATFALIEALALAIESKELTGQVLVRVDHVISVTAVPESAV